jgi:hypothetical protein
MKKTSINIILIFIALTLLSTYSCKKPSSPVSTVDSGTLYLHLHTNVDTNEVDDLGAVYTCSDGRKISVSKAQMFISNIQMVKTDGSTYTIPGVIVLKRQEIEPYFIGKVPVGSYKSVKFSVGLDAATNALTSSAATVDSPLSNSDMWFGSTAQPDGYMFVNLQGSIDTTASATGTIAQMQPFMFMIGTNANYKQITMPDHTPVYSVAKDSITYVHIICDYYKLFSGVKLNNSMNLMVMTPADNASSNATTISGNISNMFTYEE